MAARSGAARWSSAWPRWDGREPVPVVNEIQGLTLSPPFRHRTPPILWRQRPAHEVPAPGRRGPGGDRRAGRAERRPGLYRTRAAQVEFSRDAPYIDFRAIERFGPGPSSDQSETPLKPDPIASGRGRSPAERYRSWCSRRWRRVRPALPWGRQSYRDTPESLPARPATLPR